MLAFSLACCQRKNNFSFILQKTEIFDFFNIYTFQKFKFIFKKANYHIVKNTF